LYCDLSPELGEAAGGGLPLGFGEEFGRCYETCLADFKRLDRKDSRAA
jgi:hypothetical protein